MKAPKVLMFDKARLDRSCQTLQAPRGWVAAQECIRGRWGLFEQGPPA